MIIKKKIEFEVYPQDIDDKFTWNEAIEVCKKLGDGWRLPTKEELHVMWENKYIIDNCDDINYWSSSKLSMNYAWVQNFGGGDQYFSCINTYYHVHFVRNVKQNIMKFYKIQRIDNGQWMQSGGTWTDKEENGKVWKKLNHVKSAITNAKYKKRFVSPFPDVEIVIYEIKENRRIKS